MTRPLLPILLTCCALHAADTRGRFEVASVKPSAAGAADLGKIVSLNGGLLSVESMSLRTMIVYGFGVRSWEIAGIPSWASSAHYDIVGRAASPVGADKMWPMLVPLLEDRFKMQWHREKREMPVYNLVVVKSGKLPAPQPGNCVGNDPRQPPEQPKPGKRMLTACGSTLMPGLPGGAGLYGGKITMKALIGRLTDTLGRPVIDQTGFTGVFDLDLKFAIDESTPGLPLRSTGGNEQPSDPSGLPSIFTAVREQLGLKLEAGKGQVEVVVIDRIDRPSAN